MSSLVMATAEAALTDSASLLGEEVPGKLQGRTVVHWSYKLFIASAVIGAVALVAGAIFGALMIPALYSLIAVGAILCATGAYAAIEIKKFGILKSLEESTQALADRVQSLAKKIKDFQQEVNALQELNQKFKEIPEDWKEQIDAGKQEITKKAQELEKAALDISEAQMKLEKFANLTGDIQKATGNLANLVSNFDAKEHAIEGQSTRLKEELNQFNSSNSKLVEQIHQLDVNTDDFDKASQLFTGQIEVIGKLFAQVSGLLTQAQEKITSLTDESFALQRDVAQAQAAVKSVEEMESKYEVMTLKLTTEIDRLKGLERDAHKWRAYKAAGKAKETLQSIEELKVPAPSVKTPMETTPTLPSTSPPTKEPTLPQDILKPNTPTSSKESVTSNTVPTSPKPPKASKEIHKTDTAPTSPKPAKAKKEMHRRDSLYGFHMPHFGHNKHPKSSSNEELKLKDHQHGDENIKNKQSLHEETK